jgi:UDP-N-acetylglucosamine--N-acetylmuramyl-(pentapeptide) pyrophosphoryl-undecaprenol N-acetylglucosamine transferase
VGRSELTGLPVREEFFRIPPKPRGDVLNILVTGGSQGSRTLNQAARQSWPLFREAGFPIRMVVQTGASAFDSMRDDFAGSGIEADVVPFLTDMPSAMAAADLVICRSGAGAVSELAAAGRPGILIPFPFAADDHQTRNAEAMQRAGAARLIRDAEMNGQALYSSVMELARDPRALQTMGSAARSLAHPGAARRAAEILEEVARR